MKKGVVLNNFLPRISECFARFGFFLITQKKKPDQRKAYLWSQGKPPPELTLEYIRLSVSCSRCKS